MTVNLNLTPEEAALIARVLEDHLGSLRMEISNTESYEMRGNLKREEAMLKSLLDRLEQRYAEPF